MKYLDAVKLKKVMAATLCAVGVVEEGAWHVAESLVTTSLRGVDSHGINLFPHYVRAVNSGRINGSPNMSLERSGTSALKLNADHAFGHHAGSVAMSEAVKVARETGVAAISVENSTHFGAAAYFALQAARNDCIGLAFTNADALVKAHGAKERFFGTNPVCFAAPLEREEPFCLDMATSLVAWNKIMNYRRCGETLPEGWAFDGEGLPVTDPAAAVCLSPAGSYKGFGLGMMVDILCALLATAPVSKDLLPMYDSPIEARRHVSHFFLAMSIGHFTDPSLFKRSLQSMADRIRGLPPLDAAAPVLVPGDPEKRSFVERTRSGIPVEEGKLAELMSANPAFADTVHS